MPATCADGNVGVISREVDLHDLHRRYVILDRDSKFTAQLKRVLSDAGVAVVATGFQAPNMNALAERFTSSPTERPPQNTVKTEESRNRTRSSTKVTSLGSLRNQK